MLPKPDVGQKVLLEGREERFIVKSVSSDGGSVTLISDGDPSLEIHDVPCVDLLVDEGESAD